MSSVLPIYPESDTCVYEANFSQYSIWNDINLVDTSEYSIWSTLLNIFFWNDINLVDTSEALRNPHCASLQVKKCISQKPEQENENLGSLQKDFLLGHLKSKLKVLRRQILILKVFLEWSKMPYKNQKEVSKKCLGL